LAIYVKKLAGAVMAMPIEMHQFEHIIGGGVTKRPRFSALANLMRAIFIARKSKTTAIKIRKKSASASEDPIVLAIRVILDHKK
jgi:hypothetical protein